MNKHKTFTGQKQMVYNTVEQVIFFFKGNALEKKIIRA